MGRAFSEPSVEVHRRTKAHSAAETGRRAPATARSAPPPPPPRERAWLSRLMSLSRPKMSSVPRHGGLHTLGGPDAPALPLPCRAQRESRSSYFGVTRPDSRGHAVGTPREPAVAKRRIRREADNVGKER